MPIEQNSSQRETARWIRSMPSGTSPNQTTSGRSALDTSTTWVVGRRAEDFTIDPGHARATVAEHRPSVVLLASPNNPTGTALPLDTVVAVCQAAGDGQSDGTTDSGNPDSGNEDSDDNTDPQ